MALLWISTLRPDTFLICARLTSQTSILEIDIVLDEMNISSVHPYSTTWWLLRFSPLTTDYIGGYWYSTTWWLPRNKLNHLPQNNHPLRLHRRKLQRRSISIISPNTIPHFSVKIAQSRVVQVVFIQCFNFFQCFNALFRPLTRLHTY